MAYSVTRIGQRMSLQAPSSKTERQGKSIVCMPYFGEGIMSREMWLQTSIYNHNISLINAIEFLPYTGSFSH